MTDMSTRPKRIQLSRRRGWRKPEGTIVVARPTRWGNPYVVHSHERCGIDLESCSLKETQWPASDRAGAVVAFRHMLTLPLHPQPWYPDLDEIRYQLAGHDLACWCPLDDVCHADVLLELANHPEEP